MFVKEKHSILRILRVHVPSMLYTDKYTQFFIPKMSCLPNILVSHSLYACSELAKIHTTIWFFSFHNRNSDIKSTGYLWVKCRYWQKEIARRKEGKNPRLLIAVMKCYWHKLLLQGLLLFTEVRYT